ncbi:carbamoyl-phosphate synthase large subunit [Companilactobacillus nuruki]|uniref:Carbamoyl phosphate synthase large chain n=2 Tax=Bacteria TaxID=2 RepID=A0A2N7AW79_9LACO|nr:carbamoyl-phosphate synthase large subunit [Companilactobacillus nuruki]PMD72976.1 carbamoyl phosphate synthase large subunit [Companilactobacillus nuruki]
MPKRTDIKKIMIIGSGPIIIGQAAEFDYSGTQACLALKEEGYETVLINSNPATIMTDKHIADKVYIEPITLEFVEKVLVKEHPDAIIPTLGGQTGLNMAVQLQKAGILDQLGIEIIGTKLATINEAEDREEFKELMKQLHEPVPASKSSYTYKDAKKFVDDIGFPVIIRPAFTMGGTGGGVAHDYEELEEIVERGLKASPSTEVLIEQSIAGFKEIEFEVMRDSADNALAVCNMENVDPVGIHTGDSIVVSPIQTLTDPEVQKLRDVSLKIIRALKIEGGCNVQLAIDTKTSNYYIIEVNPRVSRSSALASKATGYPIAKIAAKIAVGLTLDEIVNPITEKTFAQFEPALDYVVCKIPRWPFDKFSKADRTIGTQMKATGEVMALGRNIEEALQKAVHSLEIDQQDLIMDSLAEQSLESLKEYVQNPTDDRLFYIAELLRRDVSFETINQLTAINPYFLAKIKNIVDYEKVLTEGTLDKNIVYEAKRLGYSDKTIARLNNLDEDIIRHFRKQSDILPTYKMVDTCAGEFEAEAPYFYSTYETENESQRMYDKAVLILGSGPIRIGQGIEFDYSTVHCVRAVQQMGYKAIVINNNPETVSTDYSVADKLYFEPLTLEDVLNVCDLEQPVGAIVQFGGQTSVNLAEPLKENGIRILGTQVEDINRAEDRDLFDQIIKKLNIPQPTGGTATSQKGALDVAHKIGYPVLIRPSYVLGGRAMEIVRSDQELDKYMHEAVHVSNDHPVLIDTYLTGRECEIDALSDGKDVLLPGIIEHIERSGVHSGDSMAVYPPQNISDEVQNQIVNYAKLLAKELKCIGIMNIQFVIHENQAYVIEVNPRASRTVPYLSKVTSIQMARIATKLILGADFETLGLEPGLEPESRLIHVKAPTFSFNKLKDVDSALGPEMKSTGEVMGSGIDYTEALYKAFEATNQHIKDAGNVLITVNDNDKKEACGLAKRFHDVGFQVLATKGTAQYLNDCGIKAKVVPEVGQAKEDIIYYLGHNKIQLLINTLGESRSHHSDGYIIRQNAVLNSVPLYTSLDTANAILKVLEKRFISVNPL